MRSSWIDLGKEEHPRLIARCIACQKKMGGEILLEEGSISNGSVRSPTSGEPCWRLICGDVFFWGGGPFQARFQITLWQLLCVGGGQLVRRQQKVLFMRHLGHF